MAVSLDVNVFINAVQRKAPDHHRALEILQYIHENQEIVVLDLTVAASVFRILTQSTVFDQQTTIEELKQFFTSFIESYSPIFISQDYSSWNVFSELIDLPQCSGKHTIDIYIASTMIANNLELVTFDRGFTKYPGLKVRLIPS